MRHRITAALAGAFTALGLVGGPALGQQEITPSVQESFEDWQVVCHDADGTERCSMAQDVRAQGQAERLFSVRIDIADPAQPPRMALVAPLGIDVAVPLEVFRGIEVAKFATAQTRVCQATGCFAFLSVDSDFREMIEGETTLRVRITPFRGERGEIPISLRGFDAALQRLFDLS